MKKTILLIMMILVASAVFAQSDLTSGEMSQGSIRLGVYTQSTDGTLDWVREFDGREFGRFGIEELNAYGFNGPTLYWLEARDLMIGDEDFGFSLASRNLLGVRLGTSKLTHRLFTSPALNPFIAGEYDRLSLPVPDPGLTGDSLLNLSPGVNFRLNRRVNDFAVSVTPSGSDGHRYIASWWQEMENGTRQHIFRARAATPGVIANRQRGSAAVPVDRSTSEGVLGTDLRLGKTSVVNYRFLKAEYSDSGNRPGGVLSTVNPLHSLTRFDSKTTSNSVKARSKISDTLYFTGTHTSKERKNLTSRIPSGYDSGGTPLGAKVKFRNTNLGLTFLATDALSLTGRWRRYDLDNEVPPVFRLSGTPPTPVALPDNMSFSGEVTSTEVNGSFTGIRKLYLRAGFESRNWDRTISPTHPPHPADEFEHPKHRDRTEADILRLGARYYPIQSLSFAANLEDWNVKNPGYNGMWTDRRKLNVNATYLIKTNFALYGDFIQSKDENKDVRIASIPTIVTPPAVPLTPEEEEAYVEDRADAAGQGYENDVKTTMLGAWYGVSPKLTLDTYWAKTSLDAAATLIFGNEPNYLPHLVPDFAPYNAETDQWSVGATYAINPKWRLTGRLLTSKSEGKTLISVLPGGLGPAWTPVDVDAKRWTVGATCNVSAKERVTLDYSILDWDDNIDPGQSGRFNLLRLAWSSAL